MAKVDYLWSKDNQWFERDCNGFMSHARLLSLLDHPSPKPANEKGENVTSSPLEVLTESD